MDGPKSHCYDGQGDNRSTDSYGDCVVRVNSPKGNYLRMYGTGALSPGCVVGNRTRFTREPPGLHGIGMTFSGRTKPWKRFSAMCSRLSTPRCNFVRCLLNFSCPQQIGHPSTGGFDRQPGIATETGLEEGLAQPQGSHPECFAGLSKAPLLKPGMEKWRPPEQQFLKRPPLKSSRGMGLRANTTGRTHQA